MPLIHSGETINRLLGVITAIEPPFWLGAEPLVRYEVVELHPHWPDGPPAHAAREGEEIVRLSPRRFRVLDGGLAERHDLRLGKCPQRYQFEATTYALFKGPL
jgi:hypothetical protein